MSNEKSAVILPLRVGIRFSPPALVYVYERKSGDLFPSGVLRRRIMPIRHFNESSDIQSFARELLLRHGEKMFENVPFETVCKMLRLLREHRKGIDLKTALEMLEEDHDNETKGIDLMDEKENDDRDRKLSTNETFLVENEIERTTFSMRKEETYELEVDQWEDDGDDSLEMHFRTTVTERFIKDFES